MATEPVARSGVGYEEYGGMRPADLHTIFESKLSIVAVSKSGDTNFDSLYAVWLQILKMYKIPERVQYQLFCYGFTGAAATAFVNIQSDDRNANLSPVKIWKIMARMTYNELMIQGQRGYFTAAKSRSNEIVAELADRLQELSLGLAEIYGLLAMRLWRGC